MPKMSTFYFRPLVIPLDGPAIGCQKYVFKGAWHPKQSRMRHRQTQNKQQCRFYIDQAPLAFTHFSVGKKCVESGSLTLKFNTVYRRGAALYFN